MHQQLKLLLQPRYFNRKEAMAYLGIKSYTTFANKVVDYVEVYETPFGERFKKFDLDKFMSGYKVSRKVAIH
ncbi:DNA-binding protein [Fructilactobacillus myrtifloralis]|uniref:DNA-binding protein n=1 Tax=Fructilactobacillus myrtifloralis TaxID=2940301 RepID=A0ABY5BS43_9LACO|nr:DNA-binding protein [Fructilactobacillus myrtifloralis]USS85053.1 DNA-binding protein [Fructilactobacillus myrtifloralis]